MIVPLIPSFIEIRVFAPLVVDSQVSKRQASMGMYELTRHYFDGEYIPG